MMQRSQRLRLVLGTAFISITTLVLGGCATEEHAPTEKYILVVSNAKNPYWQLAQAGLNVAAADMKVKSEVDGPDTYDAKGERDAFQKAVAQKPSGIMVSVADPATLTPDINAALAANIPVITVDSDAPDSKRMFFIGTDNYQAGLKGGRVMYKLLNGKGNVVVLTNQGQQNTADRLRGYQDAFAEHPGVKIAQTIDVKGDPTVAFDSAKQVIEGKAKVDGFVCLVAVACPEVGEVIDRANAADKYKVVAMDTDQRTTTWIQKGVISATVAQKPFTMVYYGEKLLDDLHHHPPSPLDKDWSQVAASPIPMFVDTGSFIIDKKTVDGFLAGNKQILTTAAQQ